ncbi:MAG: ParB N-terminal domain-containing protein [Verrucomicrobiae bacterium]|nr:ParB N-terminal domain-containing protein [Verrucomicrobiae bacterium]
MANELKKAHSTIQLVPLKKMRVSVNAQRELKPARVVLLANEFDPEQLGYPVLNLRDGYYWIIDGQHRIEAAKIFVGADWESQKLECRVYQHLTEKEEASMFDRLNNQLAVTTFDKFKIRVTAGRQVEVAVARVVERAGLKIGRAKDEGAIGAVGTLVKIYSRADADTLARTLRIIRDAFGDAGMTAPVLDGIAHVCQRYNGALNEAAAIEKLRDMRGGVGGLMSKANVLHKQTGHATSHCVAAATVDTINAGKGGKKLPSWWVEQ